MGTYRRPEPERQLGDRFSADERTFFAEFGKDWTLSTNPAGTSFNSGLSKTWYEVGVGVTTSMGRASEMYAKVKYSRNLGGAYRQGVFGQVGYRYSW